MCPPACVTIPYAVDSPRPVPSPTSLVVKKGSNTCAWVSRSMPMPVSRTDSSTCGPTMASMWPATSRARSVTFAVSMSRRPPAGIASRALTARLMSTCSIWVRSARTPSSLRANRVTSSMSAPMTRLSSPRVDSTTSLRSRVVGISILRRLKDSSWSTSAAPRVAACSISARSARIASSSGCSSSNSAVYPPIAVSRLLKSCAMPPASRPTASIFCDWSSSFSSCRRSVMSRLLMTRPRTAGSWSRFVAMDSRSLYPPFLCCMREWMACVEPGRVMASAKICLTRSRSSG